MGLQITYKNFNPDYGTRSSLGEAFTALVESLRTRFAFCGAYDTSGVFEKNGIVYQCRVELRSKNERYQMNALANDPATAARRLHVKIREGWESFR